MSVVEYHRPATLDEAIKFLSQTDPVCIPLGGGTGINQYGKKKVGVVDLQSLGLNTIDQEGARIKVGAAATLQALLDSPFSTVQLRKVIALEATFNQRQMATVAGRLVTADGRSPLATVLLAMDAELTWQPDGIEIGLGDWLPLRRSQGRDAGKVPGLLITSVSWPARMTILFQYVSRTPMDRPMLSVGVAGWSSGRRRVVIGGYGKAPLLAMDGPEAAGAAEAVKDACNQAGDDWASVEYRQEMAVLFATRRCLQELEGI